MNLLVRAAFGVKRPESATCRYLETNQFRTRAYLYVCVCVRAWCHYAPWQRGTIDMHTRAGLARARARHILHTPAERVREIPSQKCVLALSLSPSLTSSELPGLWESAGPPRNLCSSYSAGLYTYIAAPRVYSGARWDTHTHTHYIREIAAQHKKISTALWVRARARETSSQLVYKVQWVEEGGGRASDGWPRLFVE